MKLDGNNATRLASVTAGASLTLKNLTLTRGNGSGGNGGAISTAGTVVAEDCTFSANSATGVGGAIFSSGGSTLTLTRCTVAGNTVSYEGGGVRSTAATFTATNCTFTGNTAVIGGALSIADGGPAATLTQCTVAGNTATGIVVNGVGNVGGGGLFFYGKDAAIANCLVAGNTSPTTYGADVEAFGGVFTLSGNVIGNNDTVDAIFPAGPLVGTTAAPLNARLAPLANNGGLTQTLSLLPGSPALDAGVATASTTDQRGFTRSRDGDAIVGALPDVGAYEAQLAPAPGIGFNMGDAAVNGGDVLGSTEIAGVFPQANWNHLAGNANSGGLTPDTTTRLDASGAALPGLKLWWKGPNTWRIGNLADTADKKLMFGYLDSNGSGDGSAATDLFNNASAQPYVAIAGLPAILGGYRVLVYADGDATDGRVSSYWLASNTGQNPANVSAEAHLTPRVFLRDAANFTTTYTRATGISDTGATTSAGNYVQFDVRTETAFTVRADEHAFRAPINAVQIVRNEIIVVTTTADENDPIGTLGAGISLREAIRDAAPGSGVVFDSTLNGASVTLSAALGEIVLGKSVVIDASNLSNGVTIDGGAGTNRIFTVSDAQTVALLCLTLTGGNGGNSGANTGNAFDLSGGAIFNRGNLTLTRCTLSGNTANYSGAIDNFGTLTLTRCTIAGNSAANEAGAIFNNTTLTLTHCTLSGNFATGGGGAIRSFGTLTLNHTIAAGNAPNNIGDGFTGANNLTTGDPLLAPLGNYGGPTQTMPPLPGSPAIDTATGSTATTDQRGFPRPLDGDGNGSAIADIGAVESAAATNFIVQNAADTGAGSLRQAIADAATAPGTTITFAPGFTGPIVLTAQIVITSNVTINASSIAGGVTIDGGTGTNRIFTVSSGQTVSLTGLTLTGGNVGGGGGAIQSFGNLALIRCTLTGNTASFGGAIDSDFNTTLTLTDCTLSGNSAPTSNGGAISTGGTTTLTRCTLANNDSLEGGALGIFAPTTLIHCTVSGNTANRGGGAHHFGSGLLTLNNSIVAGNTATTAGPDISKNTGSVTRSGNCLVGKNDTVESEFPIGTPNINGDLAGTSAAPVLAQLAPLGNYGGPTQTMPPLATSPASTNTPAGPLNARKPKPLDVFTLS